MRCSPLRAAVGLSAVLLLAACGSDDAEDAATTTTTVARAESVQVPDHPFPVPDGATAVVTLEEGVLRLDYPGNDADRIVAFYDKWTSEEGSWTSQAANPEIGVVASYLADNADTIDVLRETPDSETNLLLVANGS